MLIAYTCQNLYWLNDFLCFTQVYHSDVLFDLVLSTLNRLNHIGILGL